jgi:DNA invertase Pin-like site-specific DNA recombinase
MNCAVYVRSANNQELAQNHQLEQCKTYCEKLGYSIQKFTKRQVAD